MSKLTQYVEKKTGIAESKLSFFGALLLSLLPAKTQAAIQTATDAEKAIEAAKK